MILIFGGAYQGKSGYAKEKFGVDRIYDCCDIAADKNAAPAQKTGRMDAIKDIEGFVLECVKNESDATDWFREHRERWGDKVLIMTDQSQGIVPVDAKLREAREMNGRLMIYLAGEADEVHRVFCSIGKRIK